jgi:adenosylhomocysteine nucleosidase
MFALDRECAPFRRQFSVQERCADAPGRAWFCKRDAQHFLVMEIGVGPAKTQQALDWLGPKLQRSRLLVMAGFAGSLTEEIQIGDIVVAREVVDHHGHCWPTIDLASDSPQARRTFWGRLVTSPALIGDPTEKRRLRETSGALAVDMEAATVARFCHERGQPFRCVRSISDNVDTFLSPHLVSLLSDGQVAVGRLIATTVLHPTVIPSLLKLARDTRLAARSLAKTLAFLHSPPLAPLRNECSG